MDHAIEGIGSMIKTSMGIILKVRRNVVMRGKINSLGNIFIIVTVRGIHIH